MLEVAKKLAEKRADAQVANGLAFRPEGPALSAKGAALEIRREARWRPERDHSPSGHAVEPPSR